MPSHIQLNNLAFISTSHNKKVARGFMGQNCCILVLTIPVGSKVLFLESISEYPTEREVLLDRGGSFVITGVITADYPHFLATDYVVQILVFRKNLKWLHHYQNQ
jgi:hypothetical protein